MFDNSLMIRASLQAVMKSVKEALTDFEEVATEYRVRGNGDFDCWVRWGRALIELREAYKFENNGKPPSRKQMAEYCKKYKISPATGYRWLAIAVYESPIRQQMAGLGGKSVNQHEMLEWIKQLKNYYGIQKTHHLEMPLLQGT